MVGAGFKHTESCSYIDHCFDRWPHQTFFGETRKGAAVGVEELIESFNPSYLEVMFVLFVHITKACITYIVASLVDYT